MASGAEAKLRREGIQGAANANRTHHAVGTEVRAAIERLGGTMPEELPTPAQSIAQAPRKQRQTQALPLATQGAKSAPTNGEE